MADPAPAAASPRHLVQNVLQNLLYFYVFLKFDSLLGKFDSPLELLRFVFANI